MRKTKIICTMGPATDTVPMMERLIEEGMNVARFNFSHGSYEEQSQRMDKLKEARQHKQKPIAMLLDTKGPEIRTGELAHESVELQEGNEIILTGRKCLGDDTKISLTYPTLWMDVSCGDSILIDDGLIELEVKEVRKSDICCLIKNSGTLCAHKGVNVPGVHLNLPYMSEKDRADILFGIAQGVDFVAASFVRCAKDVLEIRQLLNENGGEDINIIAKIENQEGVDHIDEIIANSDAIMIARGDMGVELPGEEVPVVQKMIIKKVYKAGKQVITATQMLDSMMEHPRPTRAEATDVANAIYDGTSGIMLSGETAAGNYPVEALQTMVRIACRTEADIDYKKRFFEGQRVPNTDVTDAICHATCTTAHDLNAAAIVTVTKSGRSARMISRYRPSCDIIGCTISEKVSRQLNMSWGVTPVLLDEKQEIFELLNHAVQAAKEEELLELGDTVVITAGVPIGISGMTNMIKVHTVQKGIGRWE